MTPDNGFQKNLVNELCQTFDCSRQDAEKVASEADKMRKSMEAHSGGMDSFEVTVDLVTKKLANADKDLGVVSKWNWYAGSIRFIDERERDFTL